tara:strand:- start:1830 stop:2429 length:600 start_codon:yes stop_codon:yes gene_type:complete
MLGIIDYGCGNIKSLSNALNAIGQNHTVIDNYKLLKKFNKIIIPGVGSYSNAIKKLKKKYFFDEIKNFANSKPILGICVGMQILSDAGYEEEFTVGLKLISGIVDKIEKKSKISHVGWNNLNISKKKNLFSGIMQNSDFYFVHSFAFKPTSSKVITSTISYNKKTIASSVESGSIFGVQFHPEKSHKNGIKILKNFCKL